MNYVYLLIDPTTDQPRYIGYTRDPKQRYKCHCVTTRRPSLGHTWRLNWVRKLAKLGLKPIMEVIGCTSDAQQAKKIEVALIGAARRLGWRLVNGTKGGDGAVGAEWTPRRRRNRSIKSKEFWTDEQRARHSALMSVDNPGARPESIQKRREWWTETRRKVGGKKVSVLLANNPVHQKKMTAAAAAAWTDERREKISVGGRGKKRIPYKPKPGQSRSAYYRSPEYLLRRREADEMSVRG
jgi:hypothetical protein